MNYYVYTLAYPDGTVFYVGKGSGNRIQHHEQEALRGHDCPKCDLIRSIWQQGGTVQRAIVFETDDERAAFTYEADLIDAYGKAALANRHAGGGGRRHGERPLRRSTGPSNRLGEPLLPACLTNLPDFAELVDRLFKTHLRPDGKEYSYQEVSDELEGELDPTMIGKIRSGKTKNPTWKTLKLLCVFFKVPPSYFFPDVEEPSDGEPPEQRLEAALRSFGLSSEAQAHLQGLIKVLQEKERTEQGGTGAEHG